MCRRAESTTTGGAASSAASSAIGAIEAIERLDVDAADHLPPVICHLSRVTVC